jgi:hypothetical protein
MSSMSETTVIETFYENIHMLCLPPAKHDLPLFTFFIHLTTKTSRRF